MKLNAIGPNQTEVTKPNGDVIFFSYNTVVSANIGGKFYRTEQRWSNTTSRHVNAWLDGRSAEYKPQSFFDALA